MTHTEIERVALRYAARAMPDEKFRALLMKVRKGAVTSISTKQWVQLLTRLGGWSISQVWAWAPNQPEGEVQIDRFEEPKLRGESLRYVQGYYESHRKKLVQSLPPSPARGDECFMDLTEPAPLEHGEGYQITYRRFLAREALRFVSPEGKLLELFMWHGAYDDSKLRGWLIKQTKVSDQAAHFLEVPTLDAEREQSKPRTRDGTGTCPCCFTNIKIKEQSKGTVMVLHGYKRPGQGSIHGRCLCVGFPPYELSADGVKHVLAHIERSLISLADYLRRLEAGETTEIITVTGRVTQSTDPKWQDVLNAKISEIQGDIEERKQNRKRAKKLVATWKLRPLPVEGGMHESYGHIF